MTTTGSTSAIDPAEPAAPAAGSLYRTFWRWHFFAGLFVVPVLAILCLSGLVWLFKPQIWSLQYGDLQHVTPAATTATYEDREQAVLAAHPDATLVAVYTPADATRSTIFDIAAADGRELMVYVDPYRGTVLGEVDKSTDLPSIALELHGSLMTGRWLGNEAIGDGFVEIVAGWGVVLLITGSYLWWPRDRGLRRALAVRGPSGRRTFWRDLHAVTGVLFSFVTLFFLLTGMAWTGVWGPNYLSVASSALGGTPEVETTSTTVGELLPNGRSAWAFGNQPIPASAPPGAVGAPLSWDPARGAPLDAVVAVGQQLVIRDGLSLYYPEDETGSYLATSWEDGPQQPNRSATDVHIAYIDQYAATPISQYGFADLGWLSKSTNVGIALHEGREFGTVNQILSAIGALALLVSLASAVVMWRRRRPTGIGAPRKVPSRTLGFGLLLVIAMLGILFPLLGASILAVLVLDTLVVQRVPALARAFGTAPNGGDRHPRGRRAA